GGGHHFHFEVGAAEGDPAIPRLDQEVGQHGQRLASLDDANDLLQRFQQSFSLNGELHVHAPSVPSPSSCFSYGRNGSGSSACGFVNMTLIVFGFNNMRWNERCGSWRT